MGHEAKACCSSLHALKHICAGTCMRAHVNCGGPGSGVQVPFHHQPGGSARCPVWLLGCLLALHDCHTTPTKGFSQKFRFCFLHACCTPWHIGTWCMFQCQSIDAVSTWCMQMSTNYSKRYVIMQPHGLNAQTVQCWRGFSGADLQFEPKRQKLAVPRPGPNNRILIYRYA